MTDHGVIDNSIAARLSNHIAPNLVTRLTKEETLPPEILQAECVRLRGDLAAIATYIPSTIVRSQLAHPEPGRISGDFLNGTVLFADLSGFTALSEKLSMLGKQGAEEISEHINNLFSALVEELYRYQGELLKFGGDALIAFFDEAQLGEGHAALASSAALALHQRMAAFAALQTRAGVFQLRLRIGVHSGRVFAAQVGDSEHIELVVTGRNINRVALAQEIAEPGEVVISRATLALLSNAVTEKRQSGFYLLESVPEVVLPEPSSNWNLELGSGDLAELLALVERIDALQPYLPCNLPQRFLKASINSAESGEFRPVTVLFTNFFPFSGALDILGDDQIAAARALNAYYSRAQQVIHHYGGIVNKVDMYTYGDKLMALFGAPVAHEDDPQRAVRAAFDLRAVLDEANVEIARLLKPAAANLIAFDPQFLRQRIGINTGDVFAGQVGSTSRREYTVMGQPVNLAARLMSAGDEGAIILSPTTRRLVERHVVLRNLPAVLLKGVTSPVQLAEALHPAEAGLRVSSSLQRPALVGREIELQQMITEARIALSGSGRVIALVGEAGTGKSRLIEEGLQQMLQISGVQGELPTFCSYGVECQSYEQNTPYAAIHEILRQFFNLVPSDIHESQSSLLQRMEELTPDLARFAPLIGDVMGLQFDDTSLTAALAPEQRHARVQELVEGLLLAGAREQPLVLTFDDLHWIDASSLELLERLTQVAADAPLLIILGYRTDPQIPEPWMNLPYSHRIVIGELAMEGSTALVRELLNGDLPPELTTLLEKTQGNPFFVEEVVRGLVESGALRSTSTGWRLTRDMNEVAIPNSIEGVITARLDRLEERSREVLQTASVIGRRFPYIVLSGVILRHDDLTARLRRLSEAELILSEEVERDLVYLFKHALTRDVAYGAILYARRRKLHRRVARQIERLYPNQINEHLALLAHHYLQAEDWQSAFSYHLRAGRQAQTRYANREAIALFEQALQIATRLEVKPEDREPGTDSHGGAPLSNLDSSVVEIYERLGVIHALIGEYDAALSNYDAALQLLEQLSDAPLDGLVRLHNYIARVYEKRADFEKAFEWVERAMRLAGDTKNSQLVRSLLLGAGLYQRQGRYAQAQEWGMRALRLAEELKSLRDQAHAFMLLGNIYRNTGDNLRAFDLTSRCLELYSQVQDLDRLADAHNNLGITCYELGRLSEARSHYEAGAELKQAIGDIYGQAMIANNLGDLFRLQDKLDEAVEQYRRSLTIFERLGSLYATGVLQMNLGATHLLRGDLDAAEAYLHRSAELFEQAGAEDFLPELQRYMAELHRRRGDVVEARRACELSLAIAARLEARVEEGASRRSLGQILMLSGDRDAAWTELQRSLEILREAASPYEVAHTLVVLASLAPSLNRYDEGQAALNQALPTLYDIGAQRGIAEVYAIAKLHGYTLQPLVRQLNDNG